MAFLVSCSILPILFLDIKPQHTGFVTLPLLFTSVTMNVWSDSNRPVSFGPVPPSPLLHLNTHSFIFVPVGPYLGPDWVNPSLPLLLFLLLLLFCRCRRTPRYSAQRMQSVMLFQPQWHSSHSPQGPSSPSNRDVKLSLSDGRPWGEDSSHADMTFAPLTSD